MSIRITFFGTILCFSALLQAQLKDDFTDGNFTTDPVWFGDVSEFQVQDQKLLSNGPDATAELYLSTPNSIIDNVVWEFYTEMGFAPSGSNKIRVYLMADQANLESDPLGYFIEIGQTGDDFLTLYRNDGGATTAILTGSTAFNAQVRVKVIRSADGEWQLFTDHSGGTNFTSEGAVTDNTYSSTSYFGIIVNHTSSRKNAFTFDDFVIDQVRVDALKVLSNTQLEITLNQELDNAILDNVSNYSISGLVIVSAKQNISQKSKITLQLDASSPLSTSDYTLFVSADLTENDAVAIDFSYLELTLESILTISATQIELSFNDDLEKISAESTPNYLIDKSIGQPSKATLSAADPSKVSITLSNPLFEGTSFNLSVSNVNNEKANSTYSGSKIFNFTIPLVIDTVEVTGANELLIRFNKSMDPVLAEQESNYLIDQSIGSPAEATLQSDGKSVLLALSARLEESTYQISLTDLKDLEGTVIDASADNYSFSYRPLSISSVTQNEDMRLKIEFNQNVEETSAETLSNYKLGEIGAPNSAVRSDLAKNEVELTFSEWYNNEYQLVVNGVSNETGNSQIESTTTVRIEKATAHRWLIISEIMADPTPSQGLPEAEYVEIFNRSDYTINLRDFKLNGEPLNNYSLAPEAYVLLTDDSNVAGFGLQNSIGIGNFDALTNGGDFVVLKDQLGNTVDSLTFAISWYGDALKDDGGYSLELIDPLKDCFDPSNWKASQASNGGTPGNKNSIFNDTDNTSPNVTSIEVDGDSLLIVTFSEALDVSSLDSEDFQVTDYTVLGFEVITLNKVRIQLSSDLESEKFHELIVSNVADCRGNELTSQLVKFYHDTKPPVLEEIRLVSSTEIALIFSESLKESRAEDEDNYLIDTNPTYRATLQDTATHRVQVRFDQEFVVQQNYTLTIAALEDTLGNAIDTETRSFQFLDDVDTAYVLTPNVLSLIFTHEPTANSSQNLLNYLLDDNSSNPVEVIQDEENPKLIQLAFAKKFDDNKELNLLVSNIRKVDGSLMNTPAYAFEYDTRAANLESIVVMNDRQIVVTWNESMDVQSATNSAYYSLEGGEQPIAITAQSATTYELTFEESFEIELIKTLSVRGVTDRSGNVATTTRRRDFVYDPRPPVLLDVTFIGENKLRLQYSEMLEFNSAINSANYSLDNANPIGQTLIGPDSTQVILTFQEVLESESLAFTAANIEDQLGNINLGDTILLSTQYPQITSIRAANDSVLLVNYSHEMNQAAFEGAGYQLTGANIRKIEQKDAKTASIELDIHLIDGDSLELTTVDLVGVNGFEVQSNSQLFVFDSYLNESQLLDQQTIELVFETEFEQIAKSSFSVPGYSVSFASIDNEETGIIRLTLNDTVPENVPFSLAWTALTDRFGRSLPDYSGSFELDTQKPKLDTVESNFFGKLTLSFSESMNQASVTSRNKYLISGVGNPKSIQLNTPQEVSLDFDDQLVIDSTYRLTVYSMADLSGNYSDTDTVTFIYQPPALPAYKELVLTEIMADPTPAIELPEVEYLELFNRGDQSFNLIGLSLNDKAFGAYELAAGDYVLLVDIGDADLFASSNVHEMDLPSLANGGGSLILRTIRNVLVDSLTYDLSWYKDNQKDDGGYSLEIIDPLGTCSPIANWTASNSETGGTPGFQNSVYSNGPDNDQPKVASWSILNQQEIAIQFSESLDDASLNTIGIDISDLGVTSYYVKYPELTEVSVLLNNKLDTGLIYGMTINGATDCSGNMMQDTTFQVGIGKVPTNGELIITEIMADPDPPVGLPNSEYVEIYNASDFLINLSSVRLRDNNSSRELANVNILARSYVILCPIAQLSTFATIGTSVGVSSWSSLTNAGETISLFTTELIDEVTYSDDWFTDQEHVDGGYSLEIINPESDCPGSANWTGSIDVQGGTPGQQNSVYSLDTDQESPIVLSIEAISADSLLITFNEAMDATSLLEASITGVEVASRAVQGELDEQLVLVLGTDLILGQIFNVLIAEAVDCSGNIMTPQTKEVGFGAAPTFNELIVTEIMADPEPVVGLPNSEYLELYNASDRLISLSGLTLKDNTSETLLPRVTLRPATYLLIAPNATLGEFQSSNKVGISGWPSLNNTGEYISIWNGESLVFEITYEDDWHAEAEQKSGGYSLEMKDLTNPCGGYLNWGSSRNTLGGTPGLPNSNQKSIPDNFGPNLTEVYLKGADTVILNFDESLSFDAREFVSFIFTPALDHTLVGFGQSRNQLIVGLNTPAQVNQPYSVAVSGAVDCNGNPIRKHTASFVRPDVVTEADVVISEVLFNPRTGGVDFIELYNKSNKYLQLQNWGLARRLEALDIDRIAERYTLFPQSYVAITVDTLALKNQYTKTANLFQVRALPTMSNDEGTIVILDPHEMILDEFSYSENYHAALLDDVDGVSLERISLDKPTQEPNNWTSASSSVGFATPGFENSQSYDFPVATGKISILPKVFVPGSTNPAFESFTTINYELDRTGQFANIMVYNQLGQPVAELAKGISLNTSGFIRWDGTSNSGNRVRMGYYVVLFELYDGEGNQQILKETVVVGR